MLKTGINLYIFWSTSSFFILMNIFTNYGFIVRMSGNIFSRRFLPVPVSARVQSIPARAQETKISLSTEQIGDVPSCFWSTMHTLPPDLYLPTIDSVCLSLSDFVGNIPFVYRYTVFPWSLGERLMAGISNLDSDMILSTGWLWKSQFKLFT